MTDAEAAKALRRWENHDLGSGSARAEFQVAIERAIVLLEREAAKREGRSVLNRFGYPR